MLLLLPLQCKANSQCDGHHHSRIPIPHPNNTQHISALPSKTITTRPADRRQVVIHLSVVSPVNPGASAAAGVAAAVAAFHHITTYILCVAATYIGLLYSTVHSSSYSSSNYIRSSQPAPFFLLLLCCCWMHRRCFSSATAAAFAFSTSFAVVNIMNHTALYCSCLLLLLFPRGGDHNGRGRQPAASYR